MGNSAFPCTFSQNRSAPSSAAARSSVAVLRTASTHSKKDQVLQVTSQSGGERERGRMGMGVNGVLSWLSDCGEVNIQGDEVMVGENLGGLGCVEHSCPAVQLCGWRQRTRLTARHWEQEEIWVPLFPCCVSAQVTFNLTSRAAFSSRQAHSSRKTVQLTTS